MKLLIRFDDYSEVSNASLDMGIIETILSAGCKALVSVIPAIADVDWDLGNGIPLRRLSVGRANMLRNLLPDGVEIGMHGYTHQTVTRWSGLAEFGDSVTLRRQTERLLDGKHCLEDLFGCEIAWFIPPWNSYGTTTLQAIRSTGFRGISADASFGPLEDGLCYTPASCLPQELQLAVKRGKSDPAAAVIVIVHDYDFQESGLKANAMSLKTFASNLTEAKANGAEPSGFSEFQRNDVVDMERAAANQRLRQCMSNSVRYAMPKGITTPYWSCREADYYAAKVRRIESVAHLMLNVYRKIIAR